MCRSDNRDVITTLGFWITSGGPEAKVDDVLGFLRIDCLGKWLLECVDHLWWGFCWVCGNNAGVWRCVGVMGLHVRVMTKFVCA
jgi:hypothetical protein